MQLFRLERPEIEKEDRLTVIQVFEDPKKRQEIGAFIGHANEPEYKYWDLVKHQRPLPHGLTSVQAWYAVKISRLLERRATKITTEDGSTFGWVKLGIFERHCHELDMHTGGDLMTSVADLKVDEKKRLISKGLMDEAIASAQLEGADTGRAYAQRMLRERIRPRNVSDQMILNNHRAMLTVEKEYKRRPLSIDLMLEMHSILAEKTLDSQGEMPRLRRNGEPIEVHDDQFVYHQGPDASFVKKELERLVDFANNDEGGFMHPIIKASVIHFWIGYLHPFTDGNGRLARLLFYWYLLRHEYWAFAYLPVAAKIKSGGKKGYTMAYVHAEQDENDLTYFISYILRKVDEAYRDFKRHLETARQNSIEIAGAARRRYGLNDRQIQLMKYLSSSKENATTVDSYMTVNGVSRATAFNDLVALVRKGLLTKKKIGRVVHFYGTGKVTELSEGASRAA